MPDLDFQAFSTVQNSGQLAPTTIASTTTIAPATFITKVSGTIDVATVTPPVTGQHMLTLIFTDASPGDLLTTGNVLVGLTTITQNAPLLLLYDNAQRKYYIKQLGVWWEGQFPNPPTTDFMIENAKAIQGWMSDEELRWLAHEASKAKTIVEFGCHRGRSTRALADNTSGTIYAVDPWVSENIIIINGKLFPTDVYDIFAENLADHIERGRVIPCKYLSDEFSRVWDAADLVFIDGNHEYSQVKKDIKRAQHIARKGGIVAGHDYTEQANCPGVKQAVDEAFPKIQQSDSIWWVINE